MPPKSNLSTVIRGIQGTPLVITDQGEAKVFLSNATSSGLATEAKQDSQIAVMTSILNNMIASLDAEILLTADDGNGGQIVQQIREYDQGTGVWSTRYEDVNGAAYVPVGPLRYLDASAVLNLILTELQAQGLTLNDIDANTDGLEALLTTIDADTSNLDVALSTIATEATLELCRLLLVDLKTNTAGLATESTLELIRLLLVSIDGVEFATEGKLEQVRVLLSTIDTDTGAIAANTESIDTRLTPATRTHNYAVSNGVGNVPAGSMCGSVLNNGSSAGTWNGNALPAGVSVEWSAVGNRDTYGAIAFDATGTEFIIEYTT